MDSVWLVVFESYALGYRSRAAAEHAREQLSAFPNVRIVKIQPVERYGFIKRANGDEWYTLAQDPRS